MMVATEKNLIKKVKNEAHLIYINTLIPNFNYKNKRGKLSPFSKNCVNL
jgi:hypothetical protein